MSEDLCINIILQCLAMVSHKVFLHLFNFIFLLCGLSLFWCGVHLIADEHRILISTVLGATNEKLAELEKPLFHYIAIGLSVSGIIVLLTSLIGCWAAFLNKFCILFTYFAMVIILLLTEFGISLLITMWPNCLGPDLNNTAMVKILQGRYGVSGNELFTAAIDLIQTTFNCCAIDSDKNYDTSLWRLQGYGKRDFAVPLTCCRLANRDEYKSYLDPVPVNLTQCQDLQKHEHETSRHLMGCVEKIEQWYREQYVIFLIGVLIIAIVEFLILLGVILNCTRKHKKSSKIQARTNDNIYHKEIPTITELAKLQENRFHIDANTVGVWSRFTPTTQY